ncbi:four helix bundle protein [Polaribacter batillariae]|uniref:Four helix bundle protein n=1 Tax=Polaribacter batillariae TaxID=2808900 RepID=A0ABX7SRA9_9FLAO|nr:four helix bundle protein [Polaribacter batillariae]QTD36775.1 four helix bundle protein [Polaribacter batillariae]
MALFTSLPVKLGYDMLIDIHKITKSFAREHKYTLGEKLKEQSLQLLIHIYTANKNKGSKRIDAITQIKEHLEMVCLLWRISKDLHIIGNKVYIKLNINIEELSKQLTAWQKYIARASA